MQALVERIEAEGRNLGGGILKVDGFINHQVDPVLMLLGVAGGQIFLEGQMREGVDTPRLLLE